MTGIDNQALDEAREALQPLPTEEGGIIVILATAGSPPAIAMLSSGDVLVTDDRVRAALYSGTAAERRLGDAFTLLVPTRDRAVRLEVTEASARISDRHVILEGRLSGARPTAEPPWGIDMRFFPVGDHGVTEFISYWNGTRRWLEDGATGESPSSP